MVMKMSQRVKNEVINRASEVEAKIKAYISKGKLMAKSGDSIDDEKYLIKTPDGNMYIISSKSVGWRVTVDRVTMDEAEDIWWDVVYTPEAKEKLEHGEEYLPRKSFILPSYARPQIKSIQELKKSRVGMAPPREREESDIVPHLASKYMKQGYSKSEAFKKAWEEYRRMKSR